MKIILLKDVPGTGKRFDVKDVAPGFATNFLIPNGLAATATDAELQKIESKRATAEAELKIQTDLLTKNLETLHGKSIFIKEKANDEGHLFAGIHRGEICKHIKSALGVEIPLEALELEKPIKNVGDSLITARVGEKKAQFHLVVEKV